MEARNEQNARKESVFSAARRDAESKLETIRLEERKEASDRKIERECDRYLDALEQYGAEHPLTQALAAMLQVVVPLRALSDKLVSMRELSGVFASTLDLIDLSIGNTFGLLDGSDAGGAFSKLKRKRKIRQFKKSVEKRMKRIEASLEDARVLSGALGDAMRGLTDPEQSNRRRKSAEEKGEPLSGLALELVGARFAARGKAAEERADSVKEAEEKILRKKSVKSSETTGEPGVDDLI